MHEMGVMLNIVDEVAKVAKENEIQKLYKLVLEIGELTGVMSNYMYSCWYSIQERMELFSETELVIKEIPGQGICSKCGSEYNLVKHDGVCPECQDNSYRVISGSELLIKEIAVE